MLSLSTGIRAVGLLIVRKAVTAIKRLSKRLKLMNFVSRKKTNPTCTEVSVNRLECSGSACLVDRRSVGSARTIQSQAVKTEEDGFHGRKGFYAWSSNKPPERPHLFESRRLTFTDMVTFGQNGCSAVVPGLDLYSRKSCFRGFVPAFVEWENWHFSLETEVDQNWALLLFSFLLLLLFIMFLIWSLSLPLK